MENIKKVEFILSIGDIEKINPPPKPINPSAVTSENQCMVELKIGKKYQSNYHWTDNDTLILVTDDKSKAILIKRPVFLLTPEEVKGYIK